MGWLRRLLDWILRRRPRPGRATNFTARVIDLSNVQLTWTLPVPTPRQRPLASFRISARVSAGLPWTEIADVAVPDTELLIQDVAPGDWFYRGVVVDSAGNASAPVFAQAEVDFEGPSPAVNFGAVVI
jgi:hypothetical protein